MTVLCASCRGKMRPLTVGGGLLMFTPSVTAYFCAKEECPRYALLAVGGVMVAETEVPA